MASTVPRIVGDQIDKSRPTVDVSASNRSYARQLTTARRGNVKASAKIDTDEEHTLKADGPNPAHMKTVRTAGWVAALSIVAGLTTSQLG